MHCNADDYSNEQYVPEIKHIKQLDHDPNIASHQIGAHHSVNI